MIEGPAGNSFRDPSGFVYRKHGIIYRQINRCYQPTWKKFISCGLYDELAGSLRLIPHQVAKEQPMQTDEGWLIIKPEPVDFWSYPYEWCFSQLKDAASLTLQIQKTALRYGMSLKDASAYNVQFVDGKPIFIDSLSFEIYNPEKGWGGFRQFCMHFLAPLALMSKTDCRLGQLFRIYMDGIPLDLTSSLLPWASWLNFSNLLYLHLHAVSEKRYSKKTSNPRESHFINLRKIQALLDSLESAINGLNFRHKSSWQDYYRDIHYGQEALFRKEKLVKAYVEMVAPKTVWDFGANTGWFSRIAAKGTDLVVSFDSDMASVESNYLACKTDGCKNILPLCLDLANPSASIGWGNNESMTLADRAPTDLVLGLALIHHLAIANNIAFDRISAWLAILAKTVIIEFVAKSDPMVQSLLSHREDIFDQYNEQSFESVFSKNFRIIESKKYEATRSIYLMQSLVNVT